MFDYQKDLEQSRNNLYILGLNVRFKNICLEANFSLNHLKWVYSGTNPSFKTKANIPSVKEIIKYLRSLGIKSVRVGIDIDQILRDSDDISTAIPDISGYTEFLDEIRLNGMRVIISFGIKTQRWPEIHISDSMINNIYGKNIPKNNSTLTIEDPLVIGMKTLRERVYDSLNPYLDIIEAIQVENEPFNRFGIRKWTLDKLALKDAIIQALEYFPNTKVLVNVSQNIGELRKLRNIYFEIEKERVGSLTRLIVGVNHYPVDPSYPLGLLGETFWKIVLSVLHYELRVLREKSVEIVITENQIEPWYGDSYKEKRFKEIGKTINSMNFLLIRTFKFLNINKENKTKTKVYLWGVEELYRSNEEGNHDISRIIRKINDLS